MKTTSVAAAVSQKIFAQQTKANKQLIDADIKVFCQQWQSEVGEQFGEAARLTIGAYCSILERGGKRIRGSLALEAYRAFGGGDEQEAIVLARVLEMMHAYLLVIDDIQDRSLVRRAGPTAHVLLERHHQDRHFRDEAYHFGMSQAINGALVAAHQAIRLLNSLKNPAIPAMIEHLNKTLVATAMGQIYDLYNEVVETAKSDDVYNVMLWKTAYYTMVNPLVMGAQLAGAGEADIKRLTDYGVPAGVAFQLGDDLLCMLADEQDSGKSPLEDIREGKRTILVLKTLEMAPKADALFLSQMLGNHNLSQAQFTQCIQIMRDCGALQAAQEELADSVVKASSIVQQSSWPTNFADYLTGLVQYLQTRRS